jgi:signal peptidase complex subunit 2
VLMFLSCVFAMVAQFYPIPFPESRPLLAVCCGAYFIISSILQVFVTFVDKDTIMFTKANKVRTVM